MKYLTIAIIATAATSWAAATAVSREEKETVKLPIINEVENTFHPYFDDKPVECQSWKIKLSSVSQVDKTWLKEHGGEAVILTKDNMVIKIGDGSDEYKPNKTYSIDEIHNDDCLTVYNKDKLVFKTDYENFKNMMSYADNEYSFIFLPITFQFYECK